MAKGVFMKKGPENRVLLELIAELQKANKDIWKRLARELSKPTRRRAAVNVSKIEQYSKDGGTVVIPGKVLGAGYLTKKVNVAAFSFSGAAKEQISKGGGKAMGIMDLLRDNPEGKDVVILI